MAKKKSDPDDPIEFTPAAPLTETASSPAEAPAEQAADDNRLEGSLASGTVSEDGTVTVRTDDGAEHQLEHGSYESLPSGRVKFAAPKGRGKR